MSLPKLQSRKGFSLIELLVVISIIGILVATATVSWTNAQQKSRDSKRKSDVKAIQQALELYFQDNGTFPSQDAAGKIQCEDPANPGSDWSILWGEDFSCFNPAITYINPIPMDPRGGTSESGTIINEYYYLPGPVLASGNILKYRFLAGLENTNDPDYCTSGCSPCDPTESRNYCVIQP